MAFFDDENRPTTDVINAVSRALDEISAPVRANLDHLELSTNESKRISTSIFLFEREVYVLIAHNKNGVIPTVFLDFSTDDANLELSDPNGQKEDTSFRTEFLDLIKRVSVELSPLLVSSFTTAHVEGSVPPKRVMPETTPIELDRIPWLGIYSEPLIDQFGGRERVLDTPAWHVEELSNNSILIITTKEPWANYTTKQPADRYLLDGDDTATT